MNSHPDRTAGDVRPPLISVVLPVYNGSEYLVEAVDSVLAQTCAHFELIMIDDGSTDGSRMILDEYAAKDPRVRVVSRENRGLATTLNDGLSMARGTWIARMDQDDIALPHRFERQLEWLEQTGADMAGSWVQRFGTSDRRVVKLHKTDAAIKMELLFCSPFAHPTVMMRAALVKRLHYDKAWEKAEDYDLWERAAEAGWKMTNVPEVLLLYRIHPDQISTLTADRQQLQGYEISRRYWRFVFHSMRLDEKSIDETLRVFSRSFPGVDVDALDASFSGLLRNTTGDARKVVFAHATRLYLRVAADCPDIVSKWDSLNNEFGEGSGAVTRLKLRLFRWLRIRVDGGLFRQLRKFHVWKASL